MKKVPHDYYLRFIDASVYEEVLEFHSKGNFTLHKAFQHHTSLHFLDEGHLAQLTGNELVLYPDMDLTVELKLSDEHRKGLLCRNESCERFVPGELEFADVEKLVGPLLSMNTESY